MSNLEIGSRREVALYSRSRFAIAFRIASRLRDRLFKGGKMTAATGRIRADFAGPLFITGMWRSGSSLLYALLNKHPQVGLMYEADLALLRPVFWKGRAANWAERWEFWNQAPSRHAFDPTGMAGKKVSFQEAYELAYKEYARRRGATIWGEKSPDLFDRMTEMARLFPEARFIVVWRNPLATNSSMSAAAEKGASFFKKPGMALRGLMGCGELRRECDALISKGHALHELDYEDLVREPASVMRGVCEFLRIPYDESVATLEGADRSAIHLGEHHSLLRGGKIVASAVRKSPEGTAHAKIDRYVWWWQSRNDGRWPKYPPPGSIRMGSPGAIERIWDAILYRFWRGIDRVTQLAFCCAPLGWLRWYRMRKTRRK